MEDIFIKIVFKGSKIASGEDTILLFVLNQEEKLLLKALSLSLSLSLPWFKRKEIEQEDYLKATLLQTGIQEVARIWFPPAQAHQRPSS